MKTTLVDIDQLIADQKNIRLHPDRNKKAIKSSIERFGAARSLVMDGDGIIRAGNGTLEQAKAAGIKQALLVESDGQKLVVVHRPDLKGMDAVAYGIADNRTTDLSLFDDDGLAETLKRIQESDYDLLGAVGYDEKELASILGPDPSDLVDPTAQLDKATELQKKWGTESGQLWVIEGKQTHRLLCGDSTKREDVERVMDGVKASCIFTDPPYGVSVARKNRLLNEHPSPTGGHSGGGRNECDIIDDDLTPEDLERTLLQSFINFRTSVMADDCTLFVCSPQGCGLSMMMMMMMMQKAGLKARHVLIWVKNQPTFSMGRLDYDYQHEPILLTWLMRHKRPMLGKHRTSVWNIDKPRASPDHPTMKPVELYANAYLNNSDEGDCVFDGYLGSGTAMVAAEQLGRRCFALEIEPKYVAVSLDRMGALGCKCRLA